MRSRTVLALALPLLGGMLATDARASDALELVRQGDFEVAGPSGIGLGWASESYGALSIRFDLDPSLPMAGRSCQHIRVDGYRNGAAQIRQLGIHLSHGNRYQITLWLRGNLSAPVRFGFRKNGQPYTYYLQSSRRVTSEWQCFAVSGTVSADDANAGLYIAFAGDGDLWIDRVSAKALGDPQVVNPLAIQSSVSPTPNPDGSWHVEYQFPWPVPGIQLLEHPRVRVLDPGGEVVGLVPLLVFQGDGLLFGFGDFRLPRRVNGPFQVYLELPFVRADGSKGVSADIQLLITPWQPNAFR